MKRALVMYGSSDDEENNVEKGVEQQSKPRAETTASVPRRKLPKLSPTLIPLPPQPDPSKHQGRVRTTPHVEGQFAAYVYIPIPLDGEGEKLGKLLIDVVKRVREIVGEDAVRCEWLEEGDERGPCRVKNGAELHVSLTRPIYLRAHQREDLKKAVRDAASTQRPFNASMATFATFENDERTRTFVGIEVGAGHSEFATLSNALSGTLLSLRQNTFYPEPRFHASFSWALLKQPPSHSASPKDASSLVDTPGTTAAQTFPVINSFPATLLTELTNRYGAALVSKVGTFEVSEVHAGIGKDVFRWRLGS